jgi:hypothetical protein
MIIRGLGELRWGQLTGQAGRIGCEAIGFPRVLKETDERQYLHLDGHINPGTRMVRKPGNPTGRRYDVNVDSCRRRHLSLPTPTIPTLPRRRRGVGCPGPGCSPPGS